MGNTSSSTSSSSSAFSALKLKGHKKEKKTEGQEEQGLHRQKEEVKKVHALPGEHSHGQQSKDPAPPSLQLPVQVELRTSQPTEPSTASTPSKPTSIDTPATARGSAASLYLTSGSTSMGSASIEHANSGEFGLTQKQLVQRSSEWVSLPSPLEQQRQALQESALSLSITKGTSGRLPPLRETCEQQSVQELSSGAEGSADPPSDQAQQQQQQQQQQRQQQQHRRRQQQQQQDPASGTAAVPAVQALGESPQEEPARAPARIPGTPRPSRKNRQVADMVRSRPHELREEEMEELLEQAAHMSARSGLSSKSALRRSYSAPGDCNQAKSVILSLIYGRYIPKDKQQPSEEASPVSARNAASQPASASQNLVSAERTASTRNASHLGLGSSTLAEQYALIWGSGGLSGRRRPSSRRPSSRRSSGAGVLAGGFPSFGNAEQHLQQLQRRQMRRERNQPSQLARALVSSFRFDNRPKLASALPGVSGPTKKTRHASMLLAALPSLGDASNYLRDKGELSRDSIGAATKPDVQAREFSTLDMLAQAKQRAQEEGHGSSSQHPHMFPPLGTTSRGKPSIVFSSPGSLTSEASFLGSPRKTFLERPSVLPEEASNKLMGGSGRHIRSDRSPRSVTFNSALSGRSGPCALQRTSSHSSGGTAEGGAPMRTSGLSHSLSGSGSGMGLLSRAIMSSCSANPDQPMCRYLPVDQQPQRSPAGVGLRQHSLPSRSHSHWHVGSPRTSKPVSASGNVDVGSPGVKPARGNGRRAERAPP